MRTGRMCAQGTLVRFILAMDHLMRSYTERSRNERLRTARTGRERVAVHSEEVCCHCCD